MRTLDFSPVFRSTIGFDRMARLVDSAMRATEAGSAPSYPPYNIEKLGEDSYRITMAVAGFGEDELDITAQDNTLTIVGKPTRDEAPKTQMLYQGIAGRAFERRFELADFIKVVGASLVNGLLHVELAREVPEAMKPRKIAIAEKVPTIEAKARAA